MVKKVCRTFDKGAKCWDAAISVSDAGGGVTGTANERTFKRSIDCGGEAQGNGSNLLVDAEAKGEEIKAKPLDKSGSGSEASHPWGPGCNATRCSGSVSAPLSRRRSARCSSRTDG
jgi:hypothetical protein